MRWSGLHLTFDMRWTVDCSATGDNRALEEFLPNLLESAIFDTPLRRGSITVARHHQMMVDAQINREVAKTTTTMLENCVTSGTFSRGKISCFFDDPTLV